jgi:hypothetical protein
LYRHVVDILRRKFRFHLQGQTLQPASAGFLLGLPFDPEDKGELFFRIVYLSLQTTGCYNPYTLQGIKICQ